MGREKKEEAPAIVDVEFDNIYGGGVTNPRDGSSFEDVMHPFLRRICKNRLMQGRISILRVAVITDAYSTFGGNIWRGQLASVSSENECKWSAIGTHSRSCTCLYTAGGIGITFSGDYFGGRT